MLKLVLATCLCVLAAGCEKRLPTSSAPPAIPAPVPAPAPVPDLAPVTVPSPARAELDEVQTSCLYIDRCLARLDKETDLTGDRAASVILAAERTLPVFWGVDPAALSLATNEKINQYPRRIREWIDKINEAKSAKILEEISKLDKQTHDRRNELSGGPRQGLIDVTNEAIGQMQKRLNGMTAGPSLNAAADLLVRLQTNLNSDRKDQLNLYQRKAIERCNQFNTKVLCNTYVSDSALINDLVVAYFRCTAEYANHSANDHT